mgnify:CR=1 FL=1
MLQSTEYRHFRNAVLFSLILAILVYLQYRHWRTFDWGTFWSQTHRINKWHVLHGIAYIYIGYLMRALRNTFYSRLRTASLRRGAIGTSVTRPPAARG